jgi:hypothetical protein
MDTPKLIEEDRRPVVWRGQFLSGVESERSPLLPEGCGRLRRRQRDGPLRTSCRCRPTAIGVIAAAAVLLEVSSSIMARTRIKLARVSQTPLDG